jgi:hypothetical protein
MLAPRASRACCAEGQSPLPDGVASAPAAAQSRARRRRGVSNTSPWRVRSGVALPTGRTSFANVVVVADRKGFFAKQGVKVDVQSFGSGLR